MQHVFHLRLNGEVVEVLAPVYKTLLEVLRENLQLTGIKHGCELGEGGTCTVLLDGTPALACLLLPIAVQGQEILTIEGMAVGSTLHELQNTFSELGAAQCGYCTPGMLLTAMALANAVYDALGVRIDEIPITPDKVLKALELRDRGQEPGGPQGYSCLLFPTPTQGRASGGVARDGTRSRYTTPLRNCLKNP